MKKPIVLLLCLFVFFGCNANINTALAAQSTSAENGQYSFYTLSGFVFGYPEEWTVADEGDDYVMFTFEDDASLITAIRVSDVSSESTPAEYLDAYSKKDAKNHSDYEYEIESVDDTPVLYQSFKQDDTLTIQYIAIIDDQMIQAIAMSKGEIPVDIQAHVKAMVLPLDEASK